MSEPLNLDAILEAINLLSEKKIEKANFNSTVVGVIRHCEDANSGAYLVEAENNTYIAYAIDREQFYKKDTPVYILKVGKDDLDKRFIIGSTETINIETIHQDKDLKYLDIIPQSLKAGYFNTTTKSNDLATASFISAVRKYGKIIIDSKITYESANNQLQNYGLKITLNYADNTSQVIYYDITHFIGNHLAFDNSQQRVFYKISNYEQFSGLTIESIEDGAEAKYTDLCIYPAIVDLTEEYGIEISGLEDYLYVDDDEDTITLSAKTLLNHRDYLMIGAEYYWFIKDDSIILDELTEDKKKYYHPYGGNGWRCVNPCDNEVKNWNTETVSQNNDLTEWFSQYNTLTLKYDIEKNDILKNDINKIKCIVIYNNKKIESNIIDCYKLGSNSFSAKITTKNGEPPQIDVESFLELQCVINPELSEGFTASYLWYRDSKLIEDSGNESLIVEGKNISQERSFICKIQISYNQDLIATIETPVFKVYSKEIELVTIVTYKRIWIKDFKKPLKYGSGKPYDDYWFGRERIILPKYYEINEEAYLDINGQWVNYGITESTDLEADFCLWECEGIVTVKKGEEPKEKDFVWSEPVIIDNSVSNEFKSPQLLQQYNTFANLTKGGTEQGLYYQLNQDETKQELYINASFIKSGTIMADLIDVDNLETKNLIVTDNKGKELLRAIQAENKVVIGGFDVDKTSLYNFKGTEGVYLGTDKFYLGSTDYENAGISASANKLFFFGNKEEEQNILIKDQIKKDEKNVGIDGYYEVGNFLKIRFDKLETFISSLDVKDLFYDIINDGTEYSISWQEENYTWSEKKNFVFYRKSVNPYIVGLQLRRGKTVEEEICSWQIIESEITLQDGYQDKWFHLFNSDILFEEKYLTLYTKDFTEDQINLLFKSSRETGRPIKKTLSYYPSEIEETKEAIGNYNIYVYTKKVSKWVLDLGGFKVQEGYFQSNTRFFKDIYCQESLGSGSDLEWTSYSVRPYELIFANKEANVFTTTYPGLSLHLHKVGNQSIEKTIPLITVQKLQNQNHENALCLVFGADEGQCINNVFLNTIYLKGCSIIPDQDSASSNLGSADKSFYNIYGKNYYVGERTLKDYIKGIVDGSITE